MTAVAHAHPTISRFGIADGVLHIGGYPVGLLAERAGTTPFFAYERTGLTRRIEELRRALPDDIHLGYAVKANPMPAVVQLLARDVCLPRAEIGDLVVVCQAGAYGMTASPTAFLGHPIPTELLV
jgi:diaminopimelate decarboxylase